MKRTGYDFYKLLCGIEDFVFIINIFIDIMRPKKNSCLRLCNTKAELGTETVRLHYIQ